MTRRLFGFVMALLLAMALFTACSSRAKEPEKPVTTGFSCDVDMTYQDMHIKGRLTRPSTGTLKMEFAEPSSLEGISMEWDGENVTVKVGALSFGVSPEEIPESALGRGLLDALDAGFRTADGATVTDEGVSTTGDSVNGQFEILSDPTTGQLISLKIPGLNVTASFSNFQWLQQAAE